MSELRQAMEERLAQAYTAYFDVERVDKAPMYAVCSYHSRSSQYVLVKSAELWAAENHEYLYLYSLPRLDTAAANAIMDGVIADGEPRIRPHPQHMYTHLTAVVLCDQIAPEVPAHLNTLKKRRDYKLSLHGWMEFRIAAVDLSTGEIFTNRSGKTLIRDLHGFVEKQIQNFHKGEEKPK